MYRQYKIWTSFQKAYFPLLSIMCQLFFTKFYMSEQLQVVTSQYREWKGSAVVNAQGCYVYQSPNACSQHVVGNRCLLGKG